MANIILAHGLWTDGATVTASSEASASLDADYVISKQPAQRWRATACAAEWVQVEMTKARAVDLVAVLGNLSPFAEIDILAAASGESLPSTAAYSLLDQTDPALPSDPSLYPTLDLDFAADTYAAGLEARERALRVFLLPSVQTYRAWRIVIRDPCNPAGYVEVNRVMLAAKIQPSRNFGFGHEVGLVDDSGSEAAIGGALLATELGRRRAFGFSLPTLPEATALGALAELDDLCGARREVLVLKDPAATTHFQRLSLYGVMRQLSPAARVARDTAAGAGLWAKRYAVEELV